MFRFPLCLLAALCLSQALLVSGSGTSVVDAVNTIQQAADQSGITGTFTNALKTTATQLQGQGGINQPATAAGTVAANPQAYVVAPKGQGVSAPSPAPFALGSGVSTPSPPAASSSWSASTDSGSSGTHPVLVWCILILCLCFCCVLAGGGGAYMYANKKGKISRAAPAAAEAYPEDDVE